MHPNHHMRWILPIVAISTILVARTVYGSIAGRVLDTEGVAIGGVTVEVWNQYPDGSILAIGSSNAMGEFNVEAPNGDNGAEFDLRFRKSLYYPSIIRYLPRSTFNSCVQLSRTPAVPGNPNACDFYHDATTFLGTSVQVGDVIEAVAQDGSPRGVTGAVIAGGWLLHVFGDDPAVEGTDGPLAGEQLGFRINGLAANLENSPIRFQPMASAEAQLTGATAVPGVTLIAPVHTTVSAGGSAFIVLTVINTGDIAGQFSIGAKLAEPWAVQFEPPGANTLEIEAGESTNVLVRIDVPNGTSNMTVALGSSAIAAGYAPANSGAWTQLEVSTISDVADGRTLVPSSFGLAQNYPNPFNSSTNISYRLERAGHVQLTISNLVGQTIKTMVDSYREAGLYTEHWDGRDDLSVVAPSGIYFARLVQYEKSSVRKLVLLK